MYSFPPNTLPRVRLVPAPDPDLGAAFRSGDREAFEALVAEHLDDVFTLCLRMTGNAADADELAQDALLRAFERRHLYREGAPVRPWLLTIAANLCRSRLRSAWWTRWRPLGVHTADEPSPELTTLEHDRDTKVRRALATLPSRYREAVALFYLDDMSYLEMSAITGVRIPALKQRVRRGRYMVEAALHKMYPELEPDRRGGGSRDPV